MSVGEEMLAHDPSRMVGDAERDAAVTQLQEHYVEGRLTLGELDQRMDGVLRSRTIGDLLVAGRGLPALPLSAPTVEVADRSGWGRLNRHRARLAGIAVATGAVVMWLSS